MSNCWLLTFPLLVLVHGSFASKILVAAPTPAISHQIPFHILIKTLLPRGHEITFISPHPLKIRHENLTEIDLSHVHDAGKEVNLVDWADMSPLDTLSMIMSLGEGVVRLQLSDPAIKDFLRKNHTFELVIYECLQYQAYHGLFHKVGSPPVVGFLTLTALAPIYHNFGSPMNPAYMPDVWLGYSDHMNFWQRLYNTYFYLRVYHMWFNQVIPAQDALVREFFGVEPPPVYESEHNFSLLITNTHFCLEYPRPLTPNIVEITGTHVPSKVEPLPKDIQQFLDGAEHGVIYFSLGSNVKSKNLSPKVIEAFLEVFRQLPQRILWKWEGDTLPGLPDNVMTRQWLPQTSVLAHPKVRLFIMQGGLQSLNEATYHGIPFVVIPFFSDQHHNAAKIAQAEMGIKLEYRDITKDTLLQSIRTVLEDPKYRNNMRALSAVFRDHREDSLDRAVWWIEYVIRHKGAPHLRSVAQDMPWWQLLLIDVIAFVLAVAAIAIYAVCFITRRIISFLKGDKQNQKQKKQ